MYNPFVLEEIEIREGHPPSWVDFVNDLIEGNDIPPSEVVILRNIKYLRGMAPIIARADARDSIKYTLESSWKFLTKIVMNPNLKRRHVPTSYFMNFLV